VPAIGGCRQQSDSSDRGLAPSPRRGGERRGLDRNAAASWLPPVTPFWKKVYFDTAVIKEWNGLWLNQRSYNEAPHVFNARHWVNSVTTARYYGAMIGERYREIRYEDVVARPADVASEVYALLGLRPSAATLERFVASVGAGAVGKYRHKPAQHLSEAVQVLEPTLTSFCYGLDEPPPQPRRGAPLPPEPPRRRSRWRLWS
jgi:hypothetical protein